MAALDMYMEKGQWQKCIETAEQQVSHPNTDATVKAQTLTLRSRPKHRHSGQGSNTDAPVKWAILIADVNSSVDIAAVAWQCHVSSFIFPEIN